MITFLHWFIKIWIAFIVLLVLISIFGTYTRTQSIPMTIEWLQYTFSPFNIVNFLVVLAFLSPVFIADKWKEKLEAKKALEDLDKKLPKQEPTKKYPY